MLIQCLETRNLLVPLSDPKGEVRSDSHPWFGISTFPKTLPSWEALHLHHWPQKTFSRIFFIPLITFFFFSFWPKKSQPAWEAEIIQYHHLLPSSAGSSEEQEGDQTGVLKKIITLQRVNVSLVMHLSSAWREEVETYIAVPCSKELGEVNSFLSDLGARLAYLGPL